MKRYLIGAGLIVLPLGTGLVLGTLFEADLLANNLLAGTYAIDFAGLASRMGILISVLVAGVVAMVWWCEYRIRHASESERQRQAEIQIDARRRFLRRLDHELKNPLTIIRLGIVNLQHSPTLDDEQKASLERIGFQADRLQKLIVDLRWLAGLEEHTLERHAVDLKETLEEVITLTQDMPGYRDREISLQLQQVPWPVSSVWADGDLLMVAFRNLVDNALKYSQPDGKVEVRVNEDGNIAVIEVADTGPGIPQEELPLIFEELYRGENARSISGSGLGLALVRRIMALHGGTISVRSRVGQGTVMTVRLPLVPDAA